MAKKKEKKLVVIVPAYNEAERIAETIAALKSVKKSLAMAGLKLNIFVINDGSTDETQALAEKAGADLLVVHKKNRGLGAAIRSGLIAARKHNADIVVKFDADLQHDPQDILRIVQPILNDEAEIVYGNRFEKIEYKMPLVRRVGNIVFTRLMALLTGWPLKDSQPGIFAVHRDYLEVFHLPGDYNYTQQILLDAYHKGMRFAQVSVAFRKRLTGKSFVSMKYPFKVSYQILMILVSVKPMKIFGSLGLIFFLAGTTIFFTELTLFLRGSITKPVEHVNLVLGLTLFGLQTIFFGLLAELIVKINRSR